MCASRHLSLFWRLSLSAFALLMILAVPAPAWSDDLEAEFHALDYKMREWERIRQSMQRIVIPQHFERDLARWEQLSGQLGLKKAKQAGDIAEAEAAKNALFEVIKSEKTVELALKGVDLAIESAQREHDFYAEWERSASIDTGVAITGNDAASEREKRRLKLQQLKDEAVARQRELRQHMARLEQQKSRLTHFQSSAKTLLTAKDIISDVDQGNFFDAAEKAIDQGSALAETYYSKETFDAVSERLEAGKGFLGTAQKLKDGNYLDGSISALDTVDKLLTDHSSKLKKETETLRLFMESDFTDQALKKQALQVISIANDRKNQMESAMDFKNKVKFSSKALSQFREVVNAVRLIDAEIRHYQSLAAVPGRSETTTKLIYGMEVLGGAFDRLADKLPPGLKETVGEFLHFYADALRLGNSIDQLVRDYFKNKGYCDNDQGDHAWSVATKHILKTWPRGELCLNFAPEFAQSGLAVYENTGEGVVDPIYFFIPNWGAIPIDLTRSQYARLVKIASDYTAYAHYVESSYRLTASDLGQIIAAIKSGSKHFTLNDGYLSDTTIDIDDLARDVDALMHLRSALGEELNTSNHRAMIDAWLKYSQDIDFYDRLYRSTCEIDLIPDNSVRHRLFVTWIKDNAQYRRFIERQRYANPASKCRVSVAINGPDHLTQGQRLTLNARIQGRNIPGDLSYRWTVSGGQRFVTQSNSLSLEPDHAGTSVFELEILVKIADGEDVIARARHSVAIEPAKKEPDVPEQKPGEKDEDDSITTPTEPAVSCSYTYSDWSDCNRATKTQTRTVTAREPAGCEERQKPTLEQSCTPPPTEEELRHRHFNCLCRCSSGWAGHIGVWYDPEGKSIPECESSGPCFGGAGAFGCTRRHFFAGPSDCAKGCWEGAWGKDTYDPAKADALRKGENRKYKKPLTVQIEASKNPADFGDIVDLTAKTSEGSGGYSWSWSGCAEEAGNDRAKAPFTQSCRPCTAGVTVTDQDGDTASDSLLVQCTALSVKLTKERPAENSLPVGDKAALLAEVFSGDQPAGGRFTYYWEPNPDVQYGGDPKNPSYETSGGAQSRNTALFRQTGRTPVWVTVLKQVGETKVTVGESEQILIDVISPQLSLKADKTSPLIGETVVLTVEETPKMSDDLVSFWWEYSGEANNPGVHPNTPNSRAWSYKPKNDKPVTITVHAKSKDSGEELDSASLTLTARRIQVSVSGPRIAGPAPMVWKPGVGLFAAEPQVAEHQRVEFAATLNPSVDDPRYQWRIEPSGCSIHSPSSRETGVTCAGTGSYSLSVTVKNADGAELGIGAGQLSVSVSQASVDSGQKTAKAIEETLAQAREQAGRGRLDEALSLAKQALALDPAYAPTKQYVASVEKAKAGLDRDLAAIEQLIGQGKLDAARSRLDTRAKAFPEYPPLVALQDRLKQSKPSVDDGTAMGVWEIVANGWGGWLELGSGCKRLRIGGSWETPESVSITAGEIGFIRPLGPQTQVYRGTVKADEIRGTFTQQDTAATLYEWSGTRLKDETLCKDDGSPTTSIPPAPGTTPIDSTSGGSPTAEPVVSFDNGNIYGVGNGPTSPTTFELEEPRILAMIQNYHWNSARGATPGTIALRDAQGRQYGPWQTEGSPGQGGVPNAYWTARPMIRLPAGVYTVIDSDPASWAQNAQSDGRGFTRIETLPASGGANP